MTTVPTLFVVSDGRGETASQVLRAALVQFEGRDVSLEVRSEVRTTEQVRRVVAEAAAREATVFYTLVAVEARRAMARESTRLLVPAVDILGPSFSALHDVFQSEPAAKPGLFYSSDRERFDRQKAIDYTLTHDDGQRPDDLPQADVVLVGVSRAAKSTTCFYLAFQGLKAANVPLVPGAEPPSQLEACDPLKVIGLNVNVTRLLTVRKARATHLPTTHVDYYLDRREVAKEVLFAAQLVASRGWRAIDASYMAVEEVAREVMRMLGRVE